MGKGIISKMRHFFFGSGSQQATKNERRTAHQEVSESFLQASSMGDLDQMKDLLRQGADINFCERPKWWNALHHAASKGQTVACRWLLDQGIEHDSTADDKYAEDIAAEAGHKETSEMLRTFKLSEAEKITHTRFASYQPVKMPPKEDCSIAAQLMRAMLIDSNLAFTHDDPITLKASVVDSICGIHAYLSVEEHRYGAGFVCYFTLPDEGASSDPNQGMLSAHAIEEISGFTSGAGLEPSWFACCLRTNTSCNFMITIGADNPKDGIEELLARYRKTRDGLRIFMNELAFRMVETDAVEWDLDFLFKEKLTAQREHEMMETAISTGRKIIDAAKSTNAAL